MLFSGGDVVLFWPIRLGCLFTLVLVISRFFSLLTFLLDCFFFFLLRSFFAVLVSFYFLGLFTPFFCLVSFFFLSATCPGTSYSSASLASLPIQISPHRFRLSTMDGVHARYHLHSWLISTCFFFPCLAWLFCFYTFPLFLAFIPTDLFPAIGGLSFLLSSRLSRSPTLWLSVPPLIAVAFVMIGSISTRHLGFCRYHFPQYCLMCGTH